MLLYLMFGLMLGMYMTHIGKKHRPDLNLGMAQESMMIVVMGLFWPFLIIWAIFFGKDVDGPDKN